MSKVEFPYKILDKKRKPGLKAKATITKVQLMKAAEVFKEKAKDPEQQLYAIQGNRRTRYANRNFQQTAEQRDFVEE